MIELEGGQQSVLPSAKFLVTLRHWAQWDGVGSLLPCM